MSPHYWLLVHYGSRVCGSGVRGSPRGGLCWRFGQASLVVEDWVFATVLTSVELWSAGLRSVRGDMGGQSVRVLFPKCPM